jgi:hypothetical protein
VTQTSEPQLPLPTSHGGPHVPFGDLVDTYTGFYGVTRKETFKRIAAATGNSINGISTRYHQRGGDVWIFGAAR